MKRGAFPWKLETKVAQDPGSVRLGSHVEKKHHEGPRGLCGRQWLAKWRRECYVSWVFQQADLQRSAHGKLIRECCWDEHLRNGKDRDLSRGRSWVCDAVLTEAPANPTGNLGAGSILQRCSELGQGAWIFILLQEGSVFPPTPFSPTLLFLGNCGSNCLG